MLRFSANLGMLWTDRPLVEAVRAAKAAGFDAVELHWPYDTPADALAAVLDETGLPVVSLNAPCGDRAAGEFGIAALPGREAEARAAVDEAVAYAVVVGAAHVHVLAGRAAGTAARDALIGTLSYAADRAAAVEIGVLIEPKNHRDVPGYHLAGMEAAVEVLDTLGRAEVKTMFDCYHLQIMQGDLTRCFERHAGLIGHVQVAGVPDRDEPSHGEIAYDRLLPAFVKMGYRGYFGAEYHPRGRVEDGLAWMEAMHGGAP